MDFWSKSTILVLYNIFNRIIKVVRLKSVQTHRTSLLGFLLGLKQYQGFTVLAAARRPSDAIKIPATVDWDSQGETN